MDFYYYDQTTKDSQALVYYDYLRFTTRQAKECMLKRNIIDTALNKRPSYPHESFYQLNVQEQEVKRLERELRLGGALIV